MPEAEVLQGILDKQARKTRAGIVLRVADARGHLIWERASGFFHGRQSRSMQPSDPFRIASVTKPITAATILRLVEKGCFALTDPIDRYLPESISALFRTKNLSLADVTLLDALRHRSGLRNFFDRNYLMMGLVPAMPRALSVPLALYLKTRKLPRRDYTAVWQPAEMLAYAARTAPFESPPRRRFHYIDTAFVLLGLVIESKTQSPLHEAYRALVFRPLGMNDTFLEGCENGPTPGHVYFHGLNVSGFNPTFDWAGGGLVSTARDLTAFLHGLFSGDLFHDTQTLNRMLNFQNVDAPVFGVLDAYGLGMGRSSFGAQQMVGHGGMWGAFAYRDQITGWIITGTTNSFGPFAMASRELITDAAGLLPRLIPK